MAWRSRLPPASREANADGDYRLPLLLCSAALLLPIALFVRLPGEARRRGLHSR